LRVYANGQAHGQCGMFHTDVPETSDDSYYSLVYYIHEDWKYEYGGHLLIKNANGCEFYWPETNSAILFNSKLQHCPLEPTIFCKSQRESIAFKFRIL
jgi:Rps23 Pro-64 3,4-dihydroxylase Tpa1-like proline 4-hydroxylase